ncbi:MAG: peptidase [Scytolyngbya sp. HA4215-MV1]|jgi:predicted Zn-dependent protease|nr:peptidase [Scytolyngbya sp. HA4215-MV1]
MRKIGRSRVVLLLLSLLLGLAIGFSAPSPIEECESSSLQSTAFSCAKAESSAPSLTAFPAPKVHPLPTRLAEWHDTTLSGDYFDQIAQTEVGYLIWSVFPIQIFVEEVATSTGNPAELERSQIWSKAVLQAIQEWNQYLPLALVTRSEAADILVWRSSPPLKASQTPGVPHRARSAETRYELYTHKTSAAEPAWLTHRCIIRLRPSQATQYLQAAARHELGHALGIWGHSPLPTDALYFSQVRNPPQISNRDVNTLKRIYEQPTRLGWSMSNEAQP